MPLKLIYDKKEDVPEGLVSYVVEKNNKWVIPVEGMSTREETERVNTLLNEERVITKGLNEKLGKLGDVDITRLSDIAELSKEFEDDFSAESYRSSMEEFKTLKEGRGKDTAHINEQLVEFKRKNTNLIKENGTLKTKFNEAEDQRIKLDTELSTGKIHEELQKKSLKAGVVPGAMVDAFNRSAGVFEFNASKELVSKDGIPGLLTGSSVEDWLISIQPETAHWYEPNQSANANGSNNNAGGFLGKNPWKPGEINLEAQGKIFVENPELATSLAKEHGAIL